MADKKLIKNLELFDPELFALVKESHSKQKTTLSLMPTSNAISPFSTFLMGSSLSNEFYDHHFKEHHSRIEKMAEDRFCELFKADHAIVRVESHAAASRVVLQGLLTNGDTILSFNLRKREHCTGENMQYNFVKFALEPDTLEIDFDKLLKQAKDVRPKLIIFSPTNYPKEIDYLRLYEVAKVVEAKLYIDIGQNAGLIAAGTLKSPVPYADVITFAANDALHGPQSGIILCKKALADTLDKAVINTGHFNLKKNMLAAFAMVAKEAQTEEYIEYTKEVIRNAQALEEGVKNANAEVILSPTENHLVLVRLPDEENGEELAAKFAEGGLFVKPEILMTMDDNISYPILRLSSLSATTRALTPKEMEEVGWHIGAFLQSPQDKESIKQIAKMIRRMVESLPIFAEDWLPELESIDTGKNDRAMQAMLHFRL